MSQLYPTLTDQARLDLDDRYTRLSRPHRSTPSRRRHRMARTLRAVADRIDD